MNSEIVNALTNAFPLIVPEIILAAGACVLFLGATFRRDRHLWGVVALLTLLVAGLALWMNPRRASAATPCVPLSTPVRCSWMA